MDCLNCLTNLFVASSESFGHVFKSTEFYGFFKAKPLERLMLIRHDYFNSGFQFRQVVGDNFRFLKPIAKVGNFVSKLDLKIGNYLKLVDLDTGLFLCLSNSCLVVSLT